MHGRGSSRRAQAAPSPLRSGRLGRRPRAAGRFAVLDGAEVLEQADGLLALLAAAILIAELFPVEIPDGDGEVSFSTTFAFALLLTDGVAAVVLVHALALALADGLRRRPLERLVFNVAQYAICWAVAGGLLVALTGDLPDENGLQYLELALRARAGRLRGGFLWSTPRWPARRRRCPRHEPLAAMRGDLGSTPGGRSCWSRSCR